MTQNKSDYLEDEVYDPFFEPEIEENVPDDEIEAMFDADSELEIAEDAELTIDDMVYHEIPLVSLLIKSVFDDFVAPGYTEEGIATFAAFTEPEALEFRESQSNYFVLVAKYGTRLAGVIEIRDFSHVSLLFVERDFQGRGISRKLMEAAIVRCHEAREAMDDQDVLEIMTVNSSPYALPIYQALGFSAVEPEQLKDGIRYVPMKKVL